MKFKSGIDLKNYMEAGPAFFSLSTLGASLNHNRLQMSASLAKSHGRNILKQLRCRKEYLSLLATVYLPLTCVIERVSHITSRAIPLLPTLSLLNSCWLTDGPCTLLGLLTHTSRYIYSLFGGYLLTSCFCCLGQHYLQAVKFSKP